MRTRPGTIRRALAAAAVVALAASCGAPAPVAAPAPPIQQERYLVGAYYYTWYPKNFGQGYLRGQLVPPQRPAIGLYRSGDPATAERHIAWASRFGVDFFAVGWWPGRDRQNQAVAKGLLRARNLGDTRFCIFYETWALGFDSVRGMTVFDRDKADRFVADMKTFAREYFANPAYLRVGGRPVVVLYLTRTFAGEYAGAVERARRELKALGVDPFFVADEIFWQVSPVGNATSGPPLTEQPQVARIRAFDAITAYNLYENTRPAQQGYPATSAFVPDALALFGAYRAAAGPGVYVVPGVIPGYNDRGVRRAVDHYVIPRQWSAGAPEGSTLGGMIDRLALPLVDPRLNMVLLSTWNEWNEDTAIEPLEPAPPTTRDVSVGGAEYTRGFAYAGHGTVPLEVVRDKFVAVAGRVADAAGTPRRGVAIAAWRDGSELARAASDSDGYYRLSRLHLPPGEYRVGVVGGAPPRPVAVGAAATTDGIDFTVAGEAGAGR
jgi:hypothetical protein